MTKEKMEYYKAMGLCPFCREHRPTEGKFRCSVCAAKHKDAQADYKDQWRKKGLCPYCKEHRPLDPGRKLCAECAVYYNPKRRARPVWVTPQTPEKTIVVPLHTQIYDPRENFNEPLKRYEEANRRRREEYQRRKAMMKDCNKI